MAKANETTVLVELEYDEPANKVVRIIRTYLSEKRALQDLELLREVHTRSAFDIQTVEHIDD